MLSRGGESSLLVPPQGKYSAQVYAWTSDGKRIVYWWGNPIRWGLLDPQTRQTTDLIAHPKYDIHGAELSPDQHWVAFNTVISGREAPLWIAAYRDGETAGEKNWIQVSADGDERPWWSPNGNLLYWISERDGFLCTWAQRLEAATKKPVGDPFAVLHFHDSRHSLATVGLATFGPAISSDRLIFALPEFTGNIWLAEPERVN